MKIIKLKCDPMGVEYFSQIYLAPDHNSEDRTFYSLYQTLTLWMTGNYHVYVPMVGEQPIGLMHGKHTEGDFYGHVYMLKEFRRKSLVALEETIKTICEDMPTQRIIAGILDTNKPARVLVSAAGFKRFKKDKYILEI
jgi:RimJ/RimL family protein N-acetyltransferase